MTIPFDSLSALTRGGQVDDLEKAAAGLEAYFLRRLLSEVRGSSGKTLLDGGHGGRMFREMLDGALADAMAAAGGVGIADMVMAQMGGADRQSAGGLSQLADVQRASAAGLAKHRYRQASAALTSMPVSGVISSDFGTRAHPIDGDRRFHTGIDLAGALGDEVRAAGAGVVVRAEAAGGYGNLIVVDHGGGMESRYAHLDEMLVAPGDQVSPGVQIGTVGETGRVTGPHLHFEVRRGGKPVDPRGEVPGLR